jgi:group I intron endonuclease
MIGNIGIYKITSPSGKVYIGQTINWRKRVSRYSVADCPKQRKLCASILKYGWMQHKAEMVHVLPPDISNDILNTYEVFYMEKYKDCGIELMNIKEGGINGKMIQGSATTKNVRQKV